MCTITKLQLHSFAKNFLQGKQIEHLFRNAGFKGNE